MQPQNQNNQNSSSPTPAMPNPLAVMQPGEEILCEIKRHPIGIFMTFAVSGLLLVALAAVAFIIVPSAAGDNSSVKALSAVGFLVFTVIDLGFVFIANTVYWGNHWIVTSDSITQMEQSSLFNKESSQLSMGNLEDIAAEKKGILASMFNFGTLKAETAGDREKFTLAFCPNPNYYAQKILSGREAFEQGHHGGKQEPYATAPPVPLTQNQDQPQPQAPLSDQPPQATQAEQLGQAALNDIPGLNQGTNERNDPNQQSQY